MNKPDFEKCEAIVASLSPDEKTTKPRVAEMMPMSKKFRTLHRKQ